MKMDRRLSNGLAWAGALLVIGIPAADFAIGAISGAAQPSVAVVDAKVETETPAPAVAEAPPPAPRPTIAAEPEIATAPQPAAVESKPAAVAANAVDTFLQSGKPLPSYISGSGATEQAAMTPKPATPAATSNLPATHPPQQQAVTPQPAAAPQIEKPAEQVAALPPAQVAPVPMPLSMRPRPVTVPLANANAGGDVPLVIDRPSTPPPAPVPTAAEPNFVTAEDLRDWESGPLSDFLAQRNSRSSATYQVQQNEPAYGGNNGFWLDEGPQNEGQFGQYPSDDRVYYLPY